MRLPVTEETEGSNPFIRANLLGSVNSHLGVSWVALEEKVRLRDNREGCLVGFLSVSVPPSI